MKPDGPTMSTEEIWEAALKQRVVAQREHKERYRGQPGTPQCCAKAGVSARIRDLKKERFGAYVIEKQRVSGGLWRYRMAG